MNSTLNGCQRSVVASRHELCSAGADLRVGALSEHRARRGVQREAAMPEVPQVPPSIYIASLADYNAGRLHGCWIDARMSVEEMQRLVAELLDSSIGPAAEEWAIHDYEGFGDATIDTHDSLEEVHELAVRLQRDARAANRASTTDGSDMPGPIGQGSRGATPPVLARSRRRPRRSGNRDLPGPSLESG